MFGSSNIRRGYASSIGLLLCLVSMDWLFIVREEQRPPAQYLAFDVFITADDHQPAIIGQLHHRGEPASELLRVEHSLPPNPPLLLPEPYYSAVSVIRHQESPVHVKRDAERLVELADARAERPERSLELPTGREELDVVVIAVADGDQGAGLYGVTVAFDVARVHQLGALVSVARALGDDLTGGGVYDHYLTTHGGSVTDDVTVACNRTPNITWL